MSKDVEIDLRQVRVDDLGKIIVSVGGFPVVVIPIKPDRTPIDNAISAPLGKGCKTDAEFLAALRWAHKINPSRMVRIIPVMIS